MPLLLDLELVKAEYVFYSQNILEGDDLMTQWLTKSTSSQGSLPAYNSYYRDPAGDFRIRPRVITPKVYITA